MKTGRTGRLWLPLTLAAVLSALLAPHLPSWGCWLLAGISLICALWAVMALQKKEPQDEAVKNSEEPKAEVQE